MNKVDYNKALESRAKALVDQMTVEEKVSLCSGKDCWTLKEVKRLGLESIAVMDGPHGLRKQVGDGDNLGIGDSVPSVCFPTASASACSFNRELLYQVGEAIGEECLQEAVSIILGPGTNQKRNPLCGRNFEYFSEDPVVSGELAASIIQGIQSKGIGTSLKHFAANNQEKRRMSVDALVDERALRELYLRAFEIAIKKGKPDTVMCAYNKLNGTYCSENKYLLTDILRDEWGYEGAVISDWGAVADRTEGIRAGLDLEMPGNDGYNDKKVLENVMNHTLSMGELNTVSTRVTKLILNGMENRRKGYKYDSQKHHDLAVKLGEESAVLLKNEGNILPGNIGKKVAVIGDFARMPRYQGAGSSRIHPIKIDSPLDALIDMGLDVTFTSGYMEDGNKRYKGTKYIEESEKRIQKAVEVAKGKDMVYLFVGLTNEYESEGFDRNILSLPKEHNQLVEEVCKVNSNIVVILFGGAPMELPWVDKVKGILLGYLLGEGCGRAIANLLLGVVSPSGKLAETWPIRLEDTPSYHYFPGKRYYVEYRESIYLGYRYYEAAKKEVLYPFGHGLSYTKFMYSDLTIHTPQCEFGDHIQISYKITNVGEKVGKETSFVFVSHENERIFLPIKELKDFQKVELKPGETKEVTAVLDTKYFGYYNTMIHDWYGKSGEYTITVGGSLNHNLLQVSLHMNSPIRPEPNLKEIAPSYFNLHKGSFQVSREEFEALYGRKINSEKTSSKPYTEINTLEDVKDTLVGKLVIWYGNKIINKVTKNSKEQEGMMLATIMEMPFFAMVASGEEMLSESMMYGILDLLNGYYIRGIRKLLK